MIFPPGSRIGILGGGQLGRMSAMAAARMGYHCHIYSPHADEPAFEVAARHSIAAYDDEAALAAFAREVDLVGFEFENIPFATAQFLENICPVRPGWKWLYLSQNRVREKKFIASLGIATAAFQEVLTLEDLRKAADELGLPAVLKTSESGYDGKGQCFIHHEADLENAWHKIGAKPAIYEAMVPFEREISVIVARSRGESEARCYPVPHNIHRNHILYQSILPSGLDAAIETEAQSIALAIATAGDLEGLLAVEMFVGQDGHVLVNEMAPRPHNSGHWSMDASVTSQFEQHIRAICGLPLGDTSLLAPVCMTNLLGNEVDNWQSWLTKPRAKLHMYGKTEARPGRKMGHVNELG